MSSAHAEVEALDGEVVAAGGELVVADGLALTAEGIAAAERQIVALREAADIGSLDDARVRMEAWRRAAELHEQYAEMLRPVARLKILVEASIGLLDLEATDWLPGRDHATLVLPSGPISSGRRALWRKLGVAHRRGVLEPILNDVEDLSQADGLTKRLLRSGVMWVDPALIAKAHSESGMTLSELSKKMGLTHSAAFSISSRSAVSFAKAVRIAKALGCSADDWPPFRPPPGDRSPSMRRRWAMKAALREKEREQAIKRAVRKQGAAIAELYTMAERMQDVMGQAHREATDSQAREALSIAGAHYRKMRDEIVRALGVL